ncbi:hypothetical protein Ancab_010908 [Ancistrocladus abbreviatus]
MIHLLFSVIFAEMFIILLLLFKTPVRKLVTMALDRLKRGKGPIVLSTVAGTVLVVLTSSVYNIIDFMSREVDPGAINPTDQVILAGHILDSTLMDIVMISRTEYDRLLQPSISGIAHHAFLFSSSSSIASVVFNGFLLFLGLIIDRLHLYIGELRLLRKTLEVAKKQSRSFDDNKNGNSDDLKALREEITSLKTKIGVLESESAAKADEAKAAEAKAEAMKKQSEGLLLEYDRLLEENQNLQSQIRDVDQSLSHSDGKKNM